MRGFELQGPAFDNDQISSAQRIALRAQLSRARKEADRPWKPAGFKRMLGNALCGAKSPDREGRREEKGQHRGPKRDPHVGDLNGPPQDHAHQLHNSEETEECSRHLLVAPHVVVLV